MKLFSGLAVAVVTMLTVLVVACGGDGDAASTGGSGPGPSIGGGMVVPNTFLTFEGKRYELVNLLQEDFVSEAEFREAGEASQADIDLRDSRVFTRNGESGAVYTYQPPTADDIGFWLAWRLVG